MLERQANATPILKGLQSSSVANGWFVKCSGVLQLPSLFFRKFLYTFDALLCMSHTVQSALESGQEARIMQVDFSAVFDRVYQQGILYKLYSVGTGGSGLSALTRFYQIGHCF